MEQQNKYAVPIAALESVKVPADHLVEEHDVHVGRHYIAPEEHAHTARVSVAYSTRTESALLAPLAVASGFGAAAGAVAHRSTMLAEQLQAALNSRVAIEQAKGVLAERNGIGMDAAFDGLRQHARNRNLKLTALALAVVRGEVDPAAVVAQATAT